MRELVAVNDPLVLSHMAALKREALMFNRIASPNFRAWDAFLDDGQRPKILAEIEWLMDKGILFEPEVIIDDRLRHDDEFINIGNDAKVLEIMATETEEEKAKRFITELNGKKFELPCVELIVRWRDVAFAMQGFMARYISLQLKVLEGMDAYPVLFASMPPVQSPMSKKSEVIQLGLSALPVPDESTSWEQIMEYRSDPDSQNKFLALRHWMSEVARAELTPTEVEEKLEYLINQYQQHMRLHRMKTNVGTLETIITTSAEFLGDLVSFKWGKAAQSLFALKRRQVALLDGELTAPGNEVAYIVKARERF